MATRDGIERCKRVIYGLSIILFPIMLLIGFLLHPDLFSFTIVTTAQQLAANFRHSVGFHIGHLVVVLAIPLIIASLLCFTEMLRGRGAWFGFVGGIIGIVGAVVLAVDKGALTLVLSAFDTLDDAAFADLVPHLQVIVDRSGLLFIVWLLPLLPLGAIIQAIGLMRESRITTWQGVAIIVGLLLLNNPDIEIISSVGALLMILGYAPLGLDVLRHGITDRAPTGG
jgi:hypothetical protein